MQRLWVFGLMGLGLGSACSFSTFKYTSCETNTACQDAFGWGMVCGEAGLCEVAAPDERCGLTFPEDLTLPVAKQDLHLMGTIFDHSSATHVARYQSAEMAVYEVNSSFGLDNVPFALVHCNSSSQEDTEAIATHLVDSLGVPTIIGPSSSGDAEAAYNALDGTDTLLISPAASSVALTALDGLASTDQDPGLFWRTAAPDTVQGAAIAMDIASRGQQDLAIIFASGAYGEGLEGVVSDAFEDGSHTITRFPFTDVIERSEAVANVAAGGHDEVLFISSSDADIIAFLNGAVGLAGYQDLPIFLTDAARKGEVLIGAAGASSLFPQIRGSAPAIPSGAVYDLYKASYSGQYDDTDVSLYSFTAHSYDAAWLAIYGHAWARYQEDGISGTHIARGLRHISSGLEVEIKATKWSEIEENFKIPNDVDVLGASGELDYDPTTGETTAAVDLWRISAENDDFEVYDTVDPS